MNQNNDEAQIRQLVADWLRALRAKDVEGLMANYAPDVLLFDLAPPLQYKGTLSQELGGVVLHVPRPAGCEQRESVVTARDDVAFSYSLNRITGKRTDGTETDVWIRATVCYRKLDGKWMVEHEHVSVPFYMDGSFRAAVDLQP